MGQKRALRDAHRPAAEMAACMIEDGMMKMSRCSEFLGNSMGSTNRIIQKVTVKTEIITHKIEDEIRSNFDTLNSIILRSIVKTMVRLSIFVNWIWLPYFFLLWLVVGLG